MNTRDSYLSLPEARKNMGFKNIRNLINKAHSIAKEFRAKETELIAILQKLDQTKAYRATGYNSLFQFCVESLELTEHQAYQYITVSRKCTEVPELMVALEDRRITVSKARKLSAVINSDNQKNWLDLAEKTSQKNLEVAVRAKVPLPPVKDHLQISSPTEVKLQATLDKACAEKLQQVIEILREKTKAPVSLNEALDQLCQTYLNQHDPVQRAKRAIKRNQKTKQKIKRSMISKSQLGENREIGLNRTALSEPSKKKSRQPLPANLKHQVMLRDRGQCRFHLNGKRCESKRYLQFHHRKPVAFGGANTIENLVLICSEHHRAIHRQF